MTAAVAPALLERLHRIDPTVRTIVEAVVPEREDVRVTPAQWETATGTGFVSLPEGGIRLTGTLGGLVTYGVHDAFLENIHPPVLTAFPYVGSFSCIMIRWGGTESPLIELHRLKAYLHPRVDGGQPQEVARWRLRLYAVVQWDSKLEIQATFDRWTVFPLADPIDVVAGGSEGEVTFDFTGQRVLPRPKLHGVRSFWRGLLKGGESVFFPDELTVPIALAVIQPLTATGAPAANAGLGYDTQQDTEPSNGLGNRLSTRVLRASVLNGTSRYLDEGTAGGAPRVTIETASFVAATATFEDAGNRFDLGAAPAEGVEYVCKAETPPGTAVTFELRNDADTAWVAVQDGQTPADLADVTATQTRKARVTLTPDAGGDVTPIVRAFGMRSLYRESFANLATLQGPRISIDPVTFKGEIGAAELRLLRMPDFADPITDLLATRPVRGLVFEVFLGDPALPRQDWFHRLSLLLEDYDPQDGVVVVNAISPLRELRQAIPVPQFLETAGANLTFVPRSPPNPARIQRAAGSWIDDNWRGGDPVTVVGSADNDGSKRIASVTATELRLAENENLVSEGPTTDPVLTAVVRRPLQVLDVSLKDAYDAIIDGPVGLAGRWRGPGIPDDSTIVSQILTETDAKVELDALAALAGGGIICDRQIRFRGLLEELAIEAVFPAETIEVLAFGPGLRYRQPTAYVNHGYDPSSQEFRGQARGFNPVGDAAFGGPPIEPAELTDKICRWIPSAVLATPVAEREVRHKGTGLILIQYRSVIPYPWLLPGSAVAVESDRFVGRDPHTGRSLRGPSWALGVIATVEDVWGTEFTVWVRSTADIIPAVDDIDLTPLSALDVTWHTEPIAGTPGQKRVWLISAVGAVISYVVRDAGATVPDYGDASYQLYDGPFTVGQFEAVDRAVMAYATRADRRSPRRVFILDADTEPEISLGISQVDADSLRYSATVDDDVIVWRLYVRVDASSWPTVDGTSTGLLDPTYLVAPDERRVGIEGLTHQIDGYSGSDQIQAIAVPIDRRGNVGARALAQFTVGGGATAALTAFSGAVQDPGSTCFDPAVYRVTWTPNGAVSDVTHDLLLWISIDGGGWIELPTEASPASNTTADVEPGWYQDAGTGLYRSVRFRYQLVAAGPTVVDEGQSKTVLLEVQAETCPEI